MAKGKFRQILSWGWKGIEVWNFLSALGGASVLRGIFRGIVGGWVWYDQLFLFGGAFLVILGILIFVFRNRKWLGAKTEAGNEQRELLDFYERQKANWKNNIRLKIVRVVQDVTGDVPKVIFWLEMTNYLPVEFELVKVTHSSGSVSAGSRGSCVLPALPETIDEKIHPCSENQLRLEMAVNGTKIPDFITSNKEAGQQLQWFLKGEWYVEIYGKTEIWATQSYQLMYDQIIVRSQGITGAQ